MRKKIALVAAFVAWFAMPARTRAGTEEAFSDCSAYPHEKKFKWSVRGEVGVLDLVASISEISCRPIIVGPHVIDRGKVVVQVPELITAGEAYHLFVSALEALGLTLEESGRSLKIVDLGRGHEVAKPALGEDPPSGEQFVLRILHIEHAHLDELGDLLTKMKSKEGDVTIYAAARALVVIDRASMVARMETLARALDVVQDGARIFTLPVHSQKASEIAATLEKVVDAGRKQGAKVEVDSDSPLAIVASDAARLIVIVGSERAYQRVLALTARLDPELAEVSGGRAHVIYLANTNAEDVLATLSQLGLARATGTSAVPGTQTPSAPLSGGTNRASPVEGDVRIAADKTSNALVVFASASDFLTVRDLVTKLDIPRRQVFVEALILDLSVDRARDLGLVFHSGAALPDGTTGLVSNQSSSANTLIVSSTQLATAVSGAGLTAGVLGKSLNVAGMDLPSFGVLLRALEQSKDVNVLSRPHLMTMDNVKAMISVGQTVPFAAQALTSAITGTASIATSYTRIPVSLELDITPHLNDSDSVRLELEGQISDVPDGQSTANPGGPTTNDRKIKTSVVVPDGVSVVLGGLEKESESDTVQKIPGLGDLPLIGRLFQYHSKQKTKQDLLIVLTPYVIRGPEDVRRITERKEQEEREFLERYSVFKDSSAFDRNVDYKRKRGLLAEIEWTARIAAEDEKARKEAERKLKPSPPSGAID